MAYEKAKVVIGSASFRAELRPSCVGEVVCLCDGHFLG